MSGKTWHIALWVAQCALCAMFCLAGFMKLTAPIAELAEMMPWVGQVPPLFVRVIGLVDLAGGLGLLLPALTRIQPGLTTLAVLGCVVLQLLAIGFHALRAEFEVLPLNAILLILSAFVLIGRRGMDSMKAVV